ncbi:DUF4258 domain-containing protein [Hydrogenimonas sp.]
MAESVTFERIVELVKDGNVLISNHGYDELADDDISVMEVVESIEKAEVLEDYPDFGKGPCCLVLQYDRTNLPVHVVWGIPKGHDKPAVLITAYRPDPKKWSADLKRRRP